MAVVWENDLTVLCLFPAAAAGRVLHHHCEAAEFSLDDQYRAAKEAIHPRQRQQRGLRGLGTILSFSVDGFGDKLLLHPRPKGDRVDVREFSPEQQDLRRVIYPN
jgi:hypothetical protein